MKIDLTEVLRKVGDESDINSELKPKEINDLDHSLKIVQPVKLDLHLVNTGNSVLVEGTASTEVELGCSRCLAPFSYPISIKIKEKFSKDFESSLPNKKKEVELQEKDFASPIAKDNTIDISDIIGQNLLLAIPIKALCETNCQGLKGQ